MSVVQNTQVIKVTANSIVGAVTDFNSRVPTAVYNFATYHTGNLPKFTGTCTWGNNTRTGTTYLTNPQAIETNQFAAKSVPSLSLSDIQITASTLWTAMYNIAVALNKVRYFVANWYHRTNDSRALVNSISGRGVMNTSFPAVTGGSDVVNSTSRYWTRSGGNVTFTPTSAITKDTQITAANMNTTIQNCYNAWYNACYTNNQITYTMYTCHLNCHSECYGVRSRR